ncbi:IQ domain-containing protein IQM2-like [Rutidosis leptorrhynchoides]|uniref:IQ domain-containing protein IQM2-like n=1 Tax=Rutidosis leptorrhynchoides TaxID=125765 RepID=UPI003A9A604F
MGLSISCPFAACTDLESSLTSLSCLKDDEARKLFKSISFESQDSESVVKYMGPQTMRAQQLFIKKNEINQESSIYDKSRDEALEFSNSDLGSPKHEAAIKLQKVYKSFRTRRKLADCAVLIEQNWWKILDSEELKRSSISFFDLNKHESAISRWARAKTRAAKVGKGLSKNCKAQKLALQHWLEAIDPRHRYGHNLQFYFLKWLHSESKEPFFYWLDIGEGKDVNLVEKCSRAKLQQQCIRYLGPMERKAYEVAIENGKLLYKETGEFLDTTGQTKGSKWIFVLSTTKTLYVGIKKKGFFQHSSFLSGGAALAAGRIIAKKGVLKAVWPHSGHYRPTQENFQDFISFLQENDVDISNVKMDSNDDDEKEYFCKQCSVRVKVNSSEEEADLEKPEKEQKKRSFTRRLSIEIPKHDDLLIKLMAQNQSTETVLDGYSDDEHEPDTEETVSKEAIFQRIYSHKTRTSFHLRRQLSRKWSTGAGPRIGCLRDYPTELQSYALEQENLSPRSLRSFNISNSTPCRTQSSPLNVGYKSSVTSGGYADSFD